MIYVLSSDFHGLRVLSRHRKIEAAYVRANAEAARHKRECACSGPIVVRLAESAEPYPIGYGVERRRW